MREPEVLLHELVSEALVATIGIFRERRSNRRRVAG
jgi:hypothetical protein